MALLSFGSLIICLVAIQVTRFVHHNPMLFGKKVVDRTQSSSPDVDNASSSTNSVSWILQEHVIMDEILQKYASLIQDDLIPYRNHCLRVLNFAIYYMSNNDATTAPAVVSEKDVDLMAMSLAYHDIGLWTNGGALAYLEPSVAVMERDMANDERFSSQDIATAREIIDQHHKVTPYKTKSGDASSSGIRTDLVNAVRLGDLADFSFGVLRSKLPAAKLQQVYELIPEAGFHRMLLSQFQRIFPHQPWKWWEILRIAKL